MKKTLATILFLGIALISPLAPFATPIAHAQAAGAGTPSLPPDTICILDHPLGAITGDPHAGDMMGCVNELLYYTVYLGGYWILHIGGEIFDSAMNFSLSKSIADQPFVYTSWGIVRDFTNLAFIFALLYIAIATILRISDFKGPLATLIMVALVINFSFFFSRVIIDASNIFALGFYDSITTTDDSAVKTVNTGSTGVTAKNISGAFVNGFNPQQLLGPGALAFSQNTAGESQLAMMLILSGIVMGIAAWAFIKVAVLLIGRIVALWLLTIASPLAFVSLILPPARSFMGKWWKMLLNQALVAPIFLFFMYIIIEIINSGFLQQVFVSPLPISNGGDLVSFIVGILLPFLVLIIAIIFATKTTMSMSGPIGNMFVDFAKKAAGVAIGGVGGTALRMASGRIGGALANAGRERGGMTGEWMNRAGMRMRTSSYDFRNIGGVKGYGKARGKGGFQGGVDARAKRVEEEAKQHEKNTHGETLYEYAKEDGSYTVTEKVKRQKMMYDGKTPDLDANGNPVYEEVEEPVKKYYKAGDKMVKTKDGKVVKDKDGNPVYRTMKDAYVDRAANAGVAKGGWRIFSTQNSMARRQAAAKVRKEKPLEDRLKEELLKESGGDTKKDESSSDSSGGEGGSH